MSPITFETMRTFVKNYLHTVRVLDVCDVGSLDVNGTFKPLFHKHNYTGLDITPGPNVDVVATDPYSYPFPDGRFDVVVSGAVVEHVKDMYRWIREVKRILKVGGILCLIAPAHFPAYHKFPVDCWRIWPDGMQFLLGEIAELDVLRIRLVREGNRVQTCLGIARRLS